MKKHKFPVMLVLVAVTALLVTVTQYLAPTPRAAMTDHKSVSWHKPGQVTRHVIVPAQPGTIIYPANTGLTSH